MPAGERKRAFEARVAKLPTAAAICADARSAQAGDGSARLAVAAALSHCAFSAPETARAVYAAFRAGWLGGEAIPALPDAPPAPLSPAFWNAFWALIEDEAPTDALTFTGRIVALAGLLDPSLPLRAEASARAHPKADVAEPRQPPPRLCRTVLAGLPTGSLGHDFCRLLMDNKFDLEVLDREALNLSTLPPALRYLNTRILQMHDIWHLAGGFATTALHEIAISAFQQSQFGHGYSAMFLAAVASRAALRTDASAPVILQTIAEASAHGERCPSFMAIDWEAEWHRPLDEIRAAHRLTPFEGSYPPDLFERLTPAG